MEDFKIRVNSKVESEEVVLLAKSIGYKMDTMFKQEWNSKYCYLSLCSDMSSGFIENVRAIENDKEITIPQLRDLVVLKRNDANDRTHTDSSGCDYYQDSHGDFYYKTISSWKRTRDLPECIKPIEKTMKEYLTKMQDGSYKLIPSKMGDEDVEVPEGAECLVTCGNNKDFIFYRDRYNFVVGMDNCWDFVGNTASEFQDEYKLSRTLWSRHAQPEELPFDDISIMDIEVLKDMLPRFFTDTKHSHYKKDVSHLDILDIYRVTELFKPHSCGAHIAKKALCSGQRGHKDLLTDIQDIIDTADRWKEMLIEDTK